MLAFPGSLGKFADLPESGSIFYTALLSFFVFTFGLIYVWMALQPAINRPLLAVSAFGKIGVFIISLYCWKANGLSTNGFLVAIADLIFGLLFLWAYMVELKNRDALSS